MNSSPALDNSYLATHFRLISRETELTDVTRHSCGLILDNATRLRNMIRHHRFPWFNFHSDGLTVVEEPIPTEFVESFAKNYDRDAVPSNSVIVAYANKDVRDYNVAVRNILHPGKAIITKGDRVVSVRNNYINARPFLNGQTALVQWVDNDLEETDSVEINVGFGKDGKRKTETVVLSFRNVVLRIQGDDGEPFDLSCKIVEDCLYSRCATLTSSYSKALWLNFRRSFPQLLPPDPNFRKTIHADPYFNAVLIKFGYAVTCHKAQGGEWDTVYVDFSGMNTLNLAAFRWSYTALTRAARKVVAINALHHGILTPLKRTLALPAPAGPASSAVVTHPVVPAPTGTTPPSEGPRGGESIEEAIARAVKSRLPDGWRISDIKHSKHLERFSIAKGGSIAAVSVYYNATGILSSIRVEPDRRTDESDELSSALSPLKGICLLLKEATSGTVHDMHAEFFEAVKTQGCAAGLAPVTFVSKSEYYGVAEFFDGTHKGSFNYYFNSDGTLCDIPTALTEVDPELVQKVVSLHTPRPFLLQSAVP